MAGFYFFKRNDEIIKPPQHLHGGELVVLQNKSSETNFTTFLLSQKKLFDSKLEKLNKLQVVLIRGEVNNFLWGSRYTKSH